MKKNIYLIILIQCCFLNLLSAQLEQGNWMIDGSLFMDFGDEDESIDFASRTTPRAGIFIIDNFLIGAGFGLETQKQGDFKERQFTFSPFFRYYFTNATLKPYGEFSLDYANFNNKNPFFDDKSSSTNLFLRLGFDYFISKNVALETNFSFRLNEDLDFFSADPNSFTLYLDENARTNLSLGFKFFLGRKGENGASTTAEPLVNRYLKAGNQSIGLNGTGVIAEGDFIIFGNFQWQKFSKDKRRWSHTIGTVMGNTLFGDGFVGIYSYRPEFQPFISLSDNAFFVPSVGLNFGASLSEQNKDFFLGGTFHPKLIYFFNNGLMEIGVDAQTPITNFKEEVSDWSGNFTLAGEYFIRNNLSLRGEVRVKAFGEPNIQEFSNLFITGYSPKSRLTIGINYFFNKGNRPKKEMIED